MIDDYKVIALINPSNNDVLRVMREILSENDGSIIWTFHSMERMQDRGISNTQVLHCLEKGTLSEPPVFSGAKGSWKFTMQHVTAGKEVGVAVALNLEDKIIIITVF
jgi:hypothetical protein